MKEYKLVIYINDAWTELDLEEAPAIQYQFSTITNLTDRLTSFSRAFKLPLTRRNCQALGHIQNSAVVSKIQFKRYPVRLYDGPVSMLPDFYVLYIDSITDTFNVQIVSSVRDFFDTLKNKSMTDYNLGNIYWNISNLIIKREDNYYYEWGLIDPTPAFKNFPTHYVYKNNDTSDKMFGFKHLFCRPIFNWYWLVNRIVEAEGYKIVTDLRDNPNYEDLYLSMGSYVDTQSQLYTDLEVRLSGQYNVLPGAVKYPYYVGWTNLITEIDMYGLKEIREFKLSFDTGVETARGCLYVAPAKINVNINAYITAITEAQESTQYCSLLIYKCTPTGVNNTSEAWNLELMTRLNGTLRYRDVERTISYGGSDYEGIQLDEGEGLFFAFRIAQPTPNLTFTNSFIYYLNCVINWRDNEFILPGGYFRFNQHTGFETPFDALKSFIQAYGLQVDVDPVNKKLYMYTFKKVLDNLQNAVDWSKKINVDETTEKSFRIDGYAKNNYVTTEENNAGISHSGNITIDNDTLNDETTLIQLPFETPEKGKVSIRSGLTTTIYNTSKSLDFSTEDYFSGDYRKYNFVGANNQQIYRVNRRLSFYVAATNLPNKVYVDTQGNLSAVKLSEVRPVDPQYFIDNFLQDFKDRVLNDVLIVKPDALLTPLDIYNIDPFIPVKIQHYGNYFYISKINNYLSDQLTQVELIRIK